MNVNHAKFQKSLIVEQFQGNYLRPLNSIMVWSANSYKQHLFFCNTLNTINYFRNVTYSEPITTYM